MNSPVYTPNQYTDGTVTTGHDYFANGGMPAATFLATTIDYSKNFTRSPNRQPMWVENVCGEGNCHVRAVQRSL